MYPMLMVVHVTKVAYPLPMILYPHLKPIAIFILAMVITYMHILYGYVYNISNNLQVWLYIQIHHRHSMVQSGVVLTKSPLTQHFTQIPSTFVSTCIPLYMPILSPFVDYFP